MKHCPHCQSVMDDDEKICPQCPYREPEVEPASAADFLHRGIAARQFQRAFVLAEGIEVQSATLDNGLLHIDLYRPRPEPRVKTIPINGANVGGDRVAGPRTIDVADEDVRSVRSRPRTGQ